MVLTEEERKERIKQSQRKWYENNKEKAKEKRRKWNEKNKNYNKEYLKTPKGKKINRISNWKERGLICDNFDELYNKYLETTECAVCKYEFDETNWRCMDHDHDTGLFRQFLCNKCNVHDNWKNH
jgi:hypothetical protein